MPRLSRIYFKINKGIEVGHVFKLGTKYSESMNAVFTDRDGKDTNFYMGCYGIGVGRVVAAAVEQHNDKNGIKLPFSISPFEVLIIPTDIKNEKVITYANDLYEKIKLESYDVAIDDRAESAGVKFKDSELIGVPYCIVVGPKSLEKIWLKLKIGEHLIKLKLAKMILVDC